MTPRMREGVVMAVTIKLCTDIPDLYGPQLTQLGERLHWDTWHRLRAKICLDDIRYGTIRLETLCLRSKQTRPSQ